ncbi:MAG: hypothetical protein JOY92_16770 [Verrucomicrobia bacterium]|nr:hypothetical protein [Verrucomicrobiota bacterium]
MRMTYEECLVTRQVLDQDRRFNGTVFSRRQWSTRDYSVCLQLRNGQEFEFRALQDFRTWHTQYRINRPARQRTGAVPGASRPAGSLLRLGAV